MVERAMLWIDLRLDGRPVARLLEALSARLLGDDWAQGEVDLRLEDGSGHVGGMAVGQSLRLRGQEIGPDRTVARWWLLADGDTLSLWLRMETEQDPQRCRLVQTWLNTLRASGARLDQREVGVLREVKADRLTALLQFLESEERRGAVVVIDDVELARQLADRLIGAAHVVLLRPDVRRELDEQLGASRQVRPKQNLAVAFPPAYRFSTHRFGRPFPIQPTAKDRDRVVPLIARAVWRGVSQRLAATPPIDAEITNHIVAARLSSARAEAAARQTKMRETIERLRAGAATPASSEDADALLVDLVELEEKHAKLVKAAKRMEVDLENEKAQRAELLRLLDQKAPEVAVALEPWDWDGLSDSFAGAICFTTNARSSWNSAKASNIRQMWSTLVALGYAAQAFRAVKGRLEQRFEEWLHIRLGSTVALQDDGLEDRGLADFQFEGQTYSRLPHVRLKSVTNGAQCTRIYFAIDRARYRFIVDHVGNHL